MQSPYSDQHLTGCLSFGVLPSQQNLPTRSHLYPLLVQGMAMLQECAINAGGQRHNFPKALHFNGKR